MASGIFPLSCFPLFSMLFDIFLLFSKTAHVRRTTIEWLNAFLCPAIG